MQGTILIVDDNSNFASFLKRLLGEEGYDIAVAHDGALPAIPLPEYIRTWFSWISGFPT